VNQPDSGLPQLAQEHQKREGELQAAPMPEDIARESEVPSEAHGEDDQTDDGGDAPGGQNLCARTVLLRRHALRRHRIGHGRSSCHGACRRERHGRTEAAGIEPAHDLKRQTVETPLAHLLDESTERPTVLSRDRVEPTGIAIALVGGEGQLAPSHRKPARRVLVDVDDEPDGPSIASGCSCRIGIPELRLEASAE
jgi:hypothetical protein